MLLACAKCQPLEYNKAKKNRSCPFGQTYIMDAYWMFRLLEDREDDEVIEQCHMGVPKATVYTNRTYMYICDVTYMAGYINGVARIARFLFCIITAKNSFCTIFHCIFQHTCHSNGGLLPFN